VSKKSYQNKYNDPHDCGWQGVAIKIIRQAIVSKDRYFLDCWSFNLWVLVAFEGLIEPDIVRDALKTGLLSGIDPVVDKDYLEKIIKQEIN